MIPRDGPAPVIFPPQHGHALRPGGDAIDEQIVSHANAALTSLEYPGRPVDVVTHAHAALAIAVMQGAAT